jgi:thiol-disulfide isomerase/thioredoxin
MTGQEELLNEHASFLPHFGLMPELSPGDVARFVALGESGRKLERGGDVEGAAEAYAAQITITPINAEPFVRLALLEAGRDNESAALDRLREAVERGFTDLAAVERAEAWARVRRNERFLALVDALPALEQAERKWGSFGEFRSERAPADLATVVGQQEGLHRRVDAMAPAIGPRSARLWSRTIDRAVAAALETYVAQKPDAPDVEPALERMLSLYAGSSLLRFERLAPDAANRLRKVSGLILESYPSSSLRPGALVCSSLARFGERDVKDVLTQSALDAIRSALGEVLDRHAGSPFVALAAEGQVRAEVAAGHMEVAGERYRGFRERYAQDAGLLARVRDELGELALWAGGLPDFRAATLDGSTLDRASVRGRVVLVDFWATWCGPCVEQMPRLDEIAERHGENVAVIGVNLDLGEDLTPEMLREWVARRGVPGVQLHDGRGWESELVRLFGVKEIPFSVLAAPDGTVLAVNAHGKALDKAVKAALASGSSR